MEFANIKWLPSEHFAVSKDADALVQRFQRLGTLSNVGHTRWVGTVNVECFLMAACQE